MCMYAMAGAISARRAQVVGLGPRRWRVSDERAGKDRQGQQTTDDARCTMGPALRWRSGFRASLGRGQKRAIVSELARAIA